MANIRIPYLVAKRNTAGVITSWHWQPSAALARAGWTALPLGRDESVAMNAARKRNDEVALWRTGGARPKQVKRLVAASTYGALVARFRRERLPLVAASTRKVYATALARLDAWAGDYPLDFVTPARVQALKRGLLASDGHHVAHATLKMGRVLGGFAIQLDLASTNPFDKFGLSAPPPRATIWSPPARELLVAAADSARDGAGDPSLALAIVLGFAIGQREGDLLAMPITAWAPLGEHKIQPEDWRTLVELAPDGIPMGIRLRQQKTGAWVEVPVVGDVRRRVEANIARAKTLGITTILFDEGLTPPRPWADIHNTGTGTGQTRMQRAFAALRDALAERLRHTDPQLAQEIAGLQFRDLRRTCVVYLGELGLDAHLIAAITGHDIDETQRILKVYMPRTTGRAARVVAQVGRIEQARADRAAAQKEGATA